MGATYLSSLLMIGAYRSGRRTLERITLLAILSLMRREGVTILKHCSVVRVCILLKSHATEKLPCLTAASKIISSRSKVFSSNCRNLTRRMLLSLSHFVLKEVPRKIHFVRVVLNKYGVLELD